MRFHIADVFLPTARDLQAFFREDEDLEGTVIDFSDSGNMQQAFAVVRIVQERTVIVPIEKLEPAVTDGTNRIQ